MAGTYSNDNRSNQGFECSICCYTREEIKVTECLHEICQICLQRIIENSGNDPTFPCPFCRNINIIPDQGASAFPTKRRKKCNSCKRNIVDNQDKCTHCGRYFCNQCRDIHIRSLNDEVPAIPDERASGQHRLMQNDNEFDYQRYGHINDTADKHNFNRSINHQELRPSALSLRDTRASHINGRTQSNVEIARISNRDIHVNINSPPVIIQPPTRHLTGDGTCPRCDRCQSCLCGIPVFASTMKENMVKFIRHWIVIPIGILLCILSGFRLIFCLGFLLSGSDMQPQVWKIEIFLFVKGIASFIFWPRVIWRCRSSLPLSRFTYILSVFSFIWLCIGTAWILETKSVILAPFIRMVTLVDWLLFAIFMFFVCVKSIVHLCT